MPRCRQGRARGSTEAQAARARRVQNIPEFPEFIPEFPEFSRAAALRGETSVFGPGVYDNKDLGSRICSSPKVPKVPNLNLK